MNIRDQHPRRRLTTRTLVVVGSLALVASACGDDDEPSAATSAPTAAPATEAPSSEMPSEMSSDTMTSPTTMAPEPTEMSSDMGTEMSGDTMTPVSGQPSGPGCASVPADGEGSFAGMTDDPAATAASNNPLLSTLVTAVTQAGLVETLNGPGPFTIFAPTNDAFAAIPPADLDAVLADNALLTSILTYHVVAGEQLSAEDLIAAGSVDTVQGGSLTFADVDGMLAVNGVPAVCVDVPTANATVHIVSGVLIPA